jgi:hypothetical protein
MERRQSRVRKMLNAANLGWVAAYSLREEKEEAGAQARPPAPRLGSGTCAGWAVFDSAPPAHSQGRPRSRLFAGPR